MLVYEIILVASVINLSVPCALIIFSSNAGSFLPLLTAYGQTTSGNIIIVSLI